MDKSNVKNQIIEILTKVQDWSGRSPETVSGTTKPIGGLEGFDSINGVEVTALICEAFGVKIDRTNVFVSESGDKVSSVSEVAEQVHKMLHSKGKVS
jgi:acyl carrier protein